MPLPQRKIKGSGSNGIGHVKEELTNKIICLSVNAGSTSSGAVWHRRVELRTTPKTLLFSQPIDPPAAGGLAMADIWVGKWIVTVDRLGNQCLIGQHPQFPTDWIGARWDELG